MDGVEVPATCSPHEQPCFSTAVTSPVALQSSQQQLLCFLVEHFLCYQEHWPKQCPLFLIPPSVHMSFFLCLQLCSAHLALLYTFTLHPNLLYKFYIHYTIHIHYIHYIHYIHVQVCMVLTDCRWIAYSSGVPGLGLCFISYHPLCLCSSTTHPCLHFSRPLKLYQSCLPMLHHYIKAINTSSYTECQLVTISCKKYGCNIQG